MPHPEDADKNGFCKVCGDRLSRPFRRKGVKVTYRRHLTNPDCETKGRGEPIDGPDDTPPIEGRRRK